MKPALLIFLLICSFSNIRAFQTTNLEVVVADQNSALVADATARLKKDENIIKESKQQEAGKIVFSGIEPGRYVLEIESPGFTLFSEEIEIGFEKIQRIVKLEIAQIVETVTVNRSNQDKNLDPATGAFTNFLTRAEIDALPDDPELMKKALKQKFGEDAEFLVDGFNSKGLPRKAEIASIKVNQSSFDAEYHKIGTAIIEITTKPTAKFFGLVNFDFNDAVLNARNPFSLVRYPEQNRAFGVILWGPIKKNKTSFLAAVANNNSYNTSTIIARLPNDHYRGSQKSPSNQFFFDGKITYTPSPFQTINLAYSYGKTDSRYLGIGGFDLPERGFDFNSQENQIRYSQAGNVRKRFYNEFRLQLENEKSKTVSISKEPVIIVLGAFNKGGAGKDINIKRKSLSIADNFLCGVKNHALKIGGSLDYGKQSIISAENLFGTFVFSGLDGYKLNRPAIFTQIAGERSTIVSQIRFGVFIQDDIKLSKSFMVNLGLRYEAQNNLKDYSNFSPRIGFTWSPKQNGKTAIRGGIGIYYNWFDLNTSGILLNQTKNQTDRTVIINPGFPDPYLYGTNQQQQKSRWQKVSDLRNPQILLGQIGIQRQLSERSSARIQYTYQKGIHLFRSRDLNAPVNFVRPNAGSGQIIQFESSAFIVKNSLKIDFDIAPTKTTFLSFNYQLAKSVTDISGYFELPTDNYNLRFDRSVANDDQRHRINAVLGWALLKGWRLSTNFRLDSPLPFTITTGKDDNSDTVFNDRPIGIARNSERGNWRKQVDASLNWQFSLGKNKADMPLLSNPNSQFVKGKMLILDVTCINVFNQTNFQTFVGVSSSPLFRQPISAGDSRKIKMSIKFSF